MKKALILAITIVATTVSSFAQDSGLTWGMVTTSVEKSDKAIQDAEKAKDIKTWLERSRVYLNLYTFDITGLYIGQASSELQLLKQESPKKRTEGAYEIWSYERIDVYIKDSKVEKWVISNPFRPEPLLTSFQALEKASSLDSLKKQTKKIKEKAENLKVDYLKGVGYEKFKLSDFSGALEYYEAAVKENELPAVNKKDTMLYVYTGIIADSAKAYDKVILYYSKAAELGYGGANMYVAIYQAYKKKNDEAGALKVLEDGIAKFGDKSGDIIVELINYYLNAKKDKEAMEYLQKAISANPTNATYYFALGTLYENTKQMDKAIETYKKTIELDPKYTEAYYNLGALYQGAGVDHFKIANETKDNAIYEKEKNLALDNYKLAIPYLEKSVELSTDKKLKYDVLSTLKVISVRLSDTEKTAKYKQQLEELQKGSK